MSPVGSSVNTIKMGQTIKSIWLLEPPGLYHRNSKSEELNPISRLDGHFMEPILSSMGQVHPVWNYQVNFRFPCQFPGTLYLSSQWVGMRFFLSLR
jgi:hypothetical protein